MTFINDPFGISSDGHPLMPNKLVAKVLAALRSKINEPHPITPEQVDETANEMGCKREEAWIALGLDPNLSVETQQETLIAICVGQCQVRGATPALEKLLSLRDERLAAGKPAFDIIPRQCLDLCPHAPVAVSRSPHGTAAHPRLRPEAIADLVEGLCEG